VQRRALGFLFSLLSLGLVGVAVAAFTGAEGAERWVIALAALALAAWLGSGALAALRK
jgi:1,4-dihydroxy-2-naphthoate octaprenyltransferase